MPSDWFNAFMTQDDTVEEKDSEHKRAIENHMARIKEVEDKTAIFFSDAVNSLSYQEYEKLMQDPEVRDKIAQTLVQQQNKNKGADDMTGQSDTIQELTYYVQRADKDLFLKLKDGIYTLDQLKARIAERRDGFRYMVLDDLKE